MQQYGSRQNLKNDTRQADKDMHVNTYFGGFLGAKRSGSKAGKKEMRQINSGP